MAARKGDPEPGTPPPALRSLAAQLGGGLAGATRAWWGDAKATWFLFFEDGRRLVAREYPSEDSAARTAAAMRIGALGGLPVPEPTVVDGERQGWLLTPHIDGTVGATWLDTPDRARTLAAAMGRLCRDGAQVHPSPEALRPEIAVPIDPGALPVEARVRQALTAALDLVAARPHQAAFVHGDFAPVNVIVGARGEIRALVDFEHAHLGDRLEDIAWWGWVVRHHHVAAWHAAWETMLDAAGVSRDDIPAIGALALVALARRALAAPERAARDHWSRRLGDAAAWAWTPGQVT